METLADFRSAAAVVGGLLALVVAGIVVARLLRYRTSRTPPPMPTQQTSHVDSDAEYLDSSHIIAGPLPGAAEGRARVAGGVAAHGGDAGKPEGHDPGRAQ